MSIATEGHERALPAPSPAHAVERAARPARAARTNDEDAAPRPPRLRPTLLGWLIAAESCLLLSSVFWQPKPWGAALGAALIAALGANALLARRLLRRVHGTWQRPERPHALDDAALGALLQAEPAAPALRVEAVSPARIQREVVGHLAAVGAAPARLSWTVRFPHRGPCWLPPLVVATDQPFGLVAAAREVSQPLEVLVLPPLGALARSMRGRLHEWLEQVTAGSEPGEDEIAHLRHYRPGDPPRRVHWKASARARALLVAERNAPACRHVAVVVDTDLRGGGGRRFERLLCAAATIIDHLHREGWEVSLHGAFAPSGITGNTLRLLEALALVQAGDDDVRSFVPEGTPALVLGCERVDLKHLRPPPLMLPLDELERLVRLPGRLR